MQAAIFMLLMTTNTTPVNAPSPPAPVTAVTVFADRALVTRQIRLTCPPERGGSVDFGALPKTAERGTLRAAIDRGRVLRIREVAPSKPDERADRKELERVRAEAARLRAEREAADAAVTRAAGYQALAETFAAEAIWRSRGAPATWAAALEASLDEMVAAAATRSVRDRALEALAEREAARVARIEQAKAAALTKAPISVDVECAPNVSTAAIALRYFVSDASWRPAYEARAHDETKALRLARLALVRQSTGEPWDNVKLTVSTAAPAHLVAAPKLAPLVVHAAPAQKKEIVTTFAPIETVPAPAGAARPRSDVLDRHGVAIEQAIPDLVNVGGDGQEMRLVLGRIEERVHPVLRAIPKLTLAAYRVIEVANRTGFPWLRGPIDLYRNGAFVGRQELSEEVPAGAHLTLSFGVEERIRIRRVALREVTRKSGLLGQRRAHIFAYRIYADSQLPKPEAIEIEENIPIAELDDVAVELEPSTTPGFEARAEDGIVRWRPIVPPGGSFALELAFRVETPAPP